MVLSRLVLNLESRAVRRDVANPYEMHATLMRLTEGVAGKPLWRFERQRGTDPPVLLLQSAAAPDKSVLDEIDPGYVLAFESKENKLVNNLSPDDMLRFRVKANPTVTRDRKRHGLVRYEDQVSWMERQLGKHGAVPMGIQVLDSKRASFRRNRGSPPITIVGVVFDGLLKVADPEALRKSVTAGIGHARAFGFGLMTLGR